jgi:hypothetical protein
MSQPDEPVSEPGLEAFLDQPTDDLRQWAWLWEEDRQFPVVSHRTGLAGKLIVAFKRLLRPFVRAPQADLWERQRVFNQILISHLGHTGRSLSSLAEDVETIGKDLQQVQEEILADMRGIQGDINGNVKGLSQDLDDFRRKGLLDVMRHTDALFSRLDQKMDRVRREVRTIAEKAPPASRSGPYRSD